MTRIFGSSAPALAACALGATPAHATERPDLPEHKTFAHVVVHHDSRTTDAKATQLGEHLERAWEKIVVELGFRRPLADGTAGGGTDLVDLYVGDVPGDPDFNGGLGTRDAAGPFMILTPHARAGYGGIVAHEFFHTVQPSYHVARGMFTEAAANWAARQVLAAKSSGGDTEWSLAEERLPLDCAYGEFRGRACGDLRFRDLFLDNLSERISPKLIRRAYELAEAWRPNTTGFVLKDPSADGLRLALQEAGHDIRDELVRHAVSVLDPTRSPFDLGGAYSFGGAPGEKYKLLGDGRPKVVDPDPVGLLSERKRTTKGSVTLGHLSWRAVRFRGYVGTARKGDKLRVTLKVSGFLLRSAPLIFTGRKLDGRRRLRRMSGTGGSYRLTIPFSQTEAFAGQPLLLINDSLDDDDARFSWDARIVRR